MPSHRKRKWNQSNYQKNCAPRHCVGSLNVPHHGNRMSFMYRPPCSRPINCAQPHEDLFSSCHPNSCQTHVPRHMNIPDDICQSRHIPSESYSGPCQSRIPIRCPIYDDQDVTTAQDNTTRQSASTLLDTSGQNAAPSQDTTGRQSKTTTDSSCQTVPLRIVDQEYSTAPPRQEDEIPPTLGTPELCPRISTSSAQTEVPYCYLPPCFDEPVCLKPICRTSSISIDSAPCRRNSNRVHPRRSVSFSCVSDDDVHCNNDYPCHTPICELFTRKCQTDCRFRHSPTVETQTEEEKDKKKRKKSKVFCECGTSASSLKSLKSKSSTQEDLENVKKKNKRKTKQPASSEDEKSDCKCEMAVKKQKGKTKQPTSSEIEIPPDCECDINGKKHNGKTKQPTSSEDEKPNCKCDIKKKRKGKTKQPASSDVEIPTDCQCDIKEKKRNGKTKQPASSEDEKPDCKCDDLWDKDVKRKKHKKSHSDDSGNEIKSICYCEEKVKRLKPKPVKTRDVGTKCECFPQPEDCTCCYPPAFSQYACSGNIVGSCQCGKQ